MIEVQNLSRNYGTLKAVDDVSFRIEGQQVVGLLGPNGAGKTTIMKMLSGYLEPSAGTVRIDGINLAEDARSIQQRLGYLPESLPVYPDMMVADYLDYAATIKGIPEETRQGAVREAIAATELQTRVLDPIKNLSRGLRQRVGVAQAILGRPQLLILDEPTNGLDPTQTEHMRELIRKLAEDAVVILSTHIMQEVDAVCDRALILRDGQLALDANLEDLRDTRNLLLKASAHNTNLATSLQQRPEVAGVELLSEDTGGCQWRIELNDGGDRDAAAHDIARCVLDAGCELYQLSPQLRDLQTVFQEVSEGGATHV